MNRILLCALAWLAQPVFAVDSYRFFHVTPDTPTYIFLGLLVFVLSPFILMIVLYWYYAQKKSKTPGQPQNRV